MTKPVDDLESQKTVASRDVSTLATRPQGSASTLAATRSGSFPLEAGALFGNYHLVRLLGQGGFGQVWEAEALDTGRRVALKVLTTVHAGSPEIQQRFEREGRLAASLNHPNCVYVFGAEQIEGYPVIAMELMPGGTLQDRLDKSGPYPFQRAVELMLDVIDGLEAAAGAGIVHRDVKPSNCFLDTAGRVKIGDFGLSKALAADSQLSIEGSFMGTPSYASPEQVKGRDIDFRTDIYSVGATLYALLTGKPPFGSGGASESLARILSEPPTSFSAHHVDIPGGLQRVVLRALAKDKEKRYASYAAFRAALLVYSSRGLSAASLAKRLVAALVDRLLFSPVSLMLSVWVIQGVDSGLALSRKASSNETVIALSLLVYFLATEGLWGNTLGKYLFGLKVRTTSGSEMSWRQAVVRSTVFVGLMNIPSIFTNRYILSNGIESGATPGAILVTLIPWLFYLAAFSTMRRKNGYAGLHELASGTRVFALTLRDSVTVPNQALPCAARLESSPAAFGPYQVRGTLWETASAALYQGHDEVLGRSVWIYRYASADTARSMASLVKNRPAKLHWLQGSRKPGNCWDVYEAPSGTSFIEWVRSRGRLSWLEMRRILRDTGEEWNWEMRQESGMAPWSLRHIWIDAYGQTRLLDFPIVPEEGSENEGAQPAEARSWRAFLHQVLLFGLEGRRLADSELDSILPRVPLPEYVRPLVQQICCGPDASSSLTSLLVNLQELSGKPARITRRKKLGALLVSGSPFLAIIVVAVVGIFSVGRLSPESRDLFNVSGYVEALKALQGRSPGAGGASQREALRMILASCYVQMKSGPIGMAVLERLQETPGNREILESAARDFPALREEQVASARVVSRKLLAHEKVETIRSAMPRVFLNAYMVTMAAGGLVAILLAWVLRGGVLLHALGITLQVRNGTRASRVRCLVRAAATWIVFVAFLPFPPFNLLFAAIGRSDVPGFQVNLAVVLLAFAGALISLITPERSLPDRLAGTVQVPR